MEDGRKDRCGKMRNGDQGIIIANKSKIERGKEMNGWKK